MYFINGEKDEDEVWVAIGVLLFFPMALVLVFISVLNTGQENPGTVERITRYDQRKMAAGCSVLPLPLSQNGLK